MATGAEARLLLASVLFAVALFATVAIAATAISNLTRDSDGAAGDFLGIYAAGRVLDGGGGEELYNLDLQKWVQQEYRPSFRDGDEYDPYVLPPVVAWTVAPLSRLDLRHAFALWAAANLALLAAVMAMLWRATVEASRSLRVTMLVVFGCSIPVVANALLGGPELLAVAALLLGFMLLRDERPIAAGVALALGVAQPHLLLGAILLLLIRCQWRTLGTLTAVGGVLVVVPSLLAGPGVLEDYARTLFAFPGTGTAAAVNVDAMPNLRGLIAGATGQTGALWWVPAQSFAAAFALGAALFAWAEDGRRLTARSWGVAAMLPLVVSPHVHMAALMLLFVAAALWLGEQRRKPALGTRLDVISCMLLLDAIFVAAWASAAVGLPLGGIVVAAAFAGALARWHEPAPVVERLDVKLAA